MNSGLRSVPEIASTQVVNFDSKLLQSQNIHIDIATNYVGGGGKVTENVQSSESLCVCLKYVFIDI